MGECTGAIIAVGAPCVKPSEKQMFHVKQLRVLLPPSPNVSRETLGAPLRVRVNLKQGPLGRNAGPPGVALRTGLTLRNPGKARSCLDELSGAHAEKSKS